MVEIGTNLFAGNEDGGVFLSTNNGTSWTAVNTGMTNTKVFSLAVSGTNLFAGTFGGVFLSTNNGASWTAVNTGLTSSFVFALYVSGTNLLAGTGGGGVFLYTNNGTNWTAISNNLPTNCDIHALAVSPNGKGGMNLFAANTGGLFRSTNNGASWTLIGIPVSHVRALAVSGANVISCVREKEDPLNNGVFLSTNNGTSWSAADTTLLDFSEMVEIGTNLFAGNYGSGVFLSTNNGTSWSSVNSGLTNKLINSLAVSGTNLFAGTEGGGVFLSTNNGTSWSGASNGLPNTSVWSLAVSGTNLFAGTDGGVFLSTNNGTSWSAVNTPFSLFSQMVEIGTSLFAGTSSGVFLSTNNGASWTAASTGLPTYNAIRALAFSGNYLFAGTSGVFLSTNNGTSWTAVNNGLTNTGVRCLAVSGTNLFAGTDGDGVWRRPLSEMITDVQQTTTQLLEKYSLSQNYPNPFNPSTTISYSIPERSNVRLSIFNTLGQNISEMVNEVRDAGSYEQSFDASQLSSGIYFYRIEAASVSNSKTFVETKKMVLMK
jgi:ligand-binding sensor domain-containing protein